MSNICLVGLGEVAQTHVAALEQIPKATLVSGVDLNPKQHVSFKGHRLPVFANLNLAWATRPADIVVIATSTNSHYEVCQQAFHLTPAPARVFVEKPIAHTRKKTHSLFADTPSGTELQPLLHFAYAPEVQWAANHLAQFEQTFGPVVSFTGQFADPRSGPNHAAKRRALGDVWLDWGINALSIISKLFKITDLSLQMPRPNTYRATLRFQSAGQARSGVIITDWNVDHAQYRTNLKFESGAVLEMDHFRVRAKLSHQDAVRAEFTGDGTPRRLSHYLNMYRDKLGRDQQGIDPHTALFLHDLLFREPAINR